MAIYIRKVVKAKWDWRNPVGSNIAANALGTDGVTNCCKLQITHYLSGKSIVNSSLVMMIKKLLLH